MPDTYVPRFTDAGMRGSQYWYSTTNPYYPANGLPNCTCYAWGRRWEILGTPDSKLPMGNGDQWWDIARARGYSTGQTPALGAIACYDYTRADYGHVAIVEEITPTYFRSSNSGWPSPYFFMDTCYQSAGYVPNWASSRYGGVLQGFIYLPGVTPVNPYQWHANGDQYSYSRDSTEAFENAVMFYSILSGLGWTLNAVVGAWANIGYEGVYNPWMWGFNAGVQSTTSYRYYGGGYGLTQETPCTVYIDGPARDYEGYAPHFSDRMGDPSDGTAQTIWIDQKWKYHTVYNSGEIDFGMHSYEAFKHGTESPEIMAEWFLRHYERPADVEYNVPLRRENARFWWNKLQNVDPFTPQPPTPSGPDKKMPLYLMTGFTNWNLY